MLRHYASPFVIGLFLVIGCDGTDTNPPPAGSTTTGTTTGTSMGGSGGSGGTGAAGATSSSGGSGGTGGADLCGNNKLDAGELCDGNELGGVTCESLNFSGGTLSCKSDCTFNIGNCIGAETCDDGIDNDGDGLIDCEEDECGPSCNDSCLMPVVLGDPDDSPGSTIGHASVLKSSCVQGSGPEITYSITASTTGMLDVVLVEDGSAAFSLSLRTDCANDASELACTVAYSAGSGFDKKLSVPVTAGDKLIVVVDGDGADAAGSFTLGVQSRPIQCGDAIQDPTETCDDGNTIGSDGCSSTCILEADETEPNNTIATANAYQMPFIGAINPESDVDYIQYTIAASAGLLIAVDGLGDAACTDGSIDSYVTLYYSAGTKLAENDDGSAGSLCSLTSKPALPPGSYFIKIEASPTAPPNAATFPYSLSVTPFQCGDGTV
ncbi:MAG: DVUA0089 family protein [Polyangiaceae bacterium]|nr:DVUA0089 family protein [Polyangiaceae bacterium]